MQKLPFMSWRRSTFNEVNDWAQNILQFKYKIFLFFTDSKEKINNENEVVSLGVQEQHQLLMSKAIRRQVVEQLWEITEKLNILYKDNWTALADREMVKFQTELFAQKTELDSFSEEPAKFVVTHAADESILVTRDGDDWSFASSFLYSLTLITTVGKHNWTKFPNLNFPLF